MNEIVRITERDLHNLIKESVNNILSKISAGDDDSPSEVEFMADKLCSFGIPWNESCNYAEYICKNYKRASTIPLKDLVYYLKTIMDESDWEKYFKIINYKVHSDVDGSPWIGLPDDSWVEYDVLIKKTKQVVSHYEECL